MITEAGSGEDSEEFRRVGDMKKTDRQRPGEKSKAAVSVSLVSSERKSRGRVREDTHSLFRRLIEACPLIMETCLLRSNSASEPSACGRSWPPTRPWSCFTGTSAALFLIGRRRKAGAPESSTGCPQTFAMKMHYQKGHQNILAENENRLYAILERGFPGSFSPFLKSGGFCSRIKC